MPAQSNRQTARPILRRLNQGASLRCNDPRMNSNDCLTPAAPDTAEELGRWLEHLATERRMSAKNCEAYSRDVVQFLRFMAEHLGGRVTLARLAKLSPADVRAFMAARRGEGIAGRSL